MRSWLLYSLGLLLVGLAGCDEVTSTTSSVSTDVTCHATHQCDFDALTCTSTFDETFTTFQDDYGDEFDHHITITDHTSIVRHDEVDEYASVLATFQTETLTTQTVDDYITIDPYGHEEISRTETETITVTTWQQECPTCVSWVCTSSGVGEESCYITTTLPAFPVCTG